MDRACRMAHGILTDSMTRMDDNKVAAAAASVSVLVCERQAVRKNTARRRCWLHSWQALSSPWGPFWSSHDAIWCVHSLGDPPALCLVTTPALLGPIVDAAVYETNQDCAQ